MLYGTVLVHKHQSYWSLWLITGRYKLKARMKPLSPCFRNWFKKKCEGPWEWGMHVPRRALFYAACGASNIDCWRSRWRPSVSALLLGPLSFLQMENYFLTCCDTHMMTVPGKFPSIFLNSFITLDGSVTNCLAQIFTNNFPFQKVCLKNVNKVELGSCGCLCSRLGQGYWGWGVLPRRWFLVPGCAGGLLLPTWVWCPQRQQSSQSCELQDPRQNEASFTWYLVSRYFPLCSHTNEHLLLTCLAMDLPEFVQ